jgi:capsular polysaccharide transport system ATP-binding protein
MAIDFDCILIDEVIAVGDQRFRNKCTDALWDPKRGRSTVLVSHNDDLIRHYCDRAFVLVKGKLYPFGSADDAIAFYNETLYT